MDDRDYLNIFKTREEIIKTAMAQAIAKRQGDNKPLRRMLLIMLLFIIWFLVAIFVFKP